MISGPVLCSQQYCSIDERLWIIGILFYNLPILKESGPPEVLLAHMAKKSRSTQAVSIFYDSSWVLPRVCPCHSHLKTYEEEGTPFISAHRWTLGNKRESQTFFFPFALST